MDDKNYPQPPQQQPPQENGSQQRSPHVRQPFVVTIEEGDDNYVADSPAYKGEVYFANPPQPPLPAQNTRAKTARQKGQTTKLSLILAVAVVALSVLLSVYAVSCLNDVLAMNRTSEIIIVNIPQDATTNEIIDLLDDADLIRHPMFCKLFYNVTSAMRNSTLSKEGRGTVYKIFYGIKGAFTDSSTTSYIEGVYYVEADLGVEGMLNRFRYTRSTAETVTLTFPEGFSIYQIFARLEEAGVCKADHLYKALEESDFKFDFINQLEPNADRTQLLEGYIFPAQYEFFLNENANSVLRRFLDTFEDRWTAERQKRATELGLTMDEVIILASIIQREAANNEQMAGISSVLHNRLKNSTSFPLLECNSTKDYVTNFVSIAISGSRLTELEALYNTYTTKGLPPGPICNPGAAAIDAVLHPSNTGYFYFRHDNKGKIYYAKTLQEHDANRLEVLKANQ